ncbi:unnamed protein product, partial [Prorocentrum cordatum]
ARCLPATARVGHRARRRCPQAGQGREHGCGNFGGGEGGGGEEDEGGRRALRAEGGQLYISMGPASACGRHGAAEAPLRGDLGGASAGGVGEPLLGATGGVRQDRLVGLLVAPQGRQVQRRAPGQVPGVHRGELLAAHDGQGAPARRRATARWSALAMSRSTASAARKKALPSRARHTSSSGPPARRGAAWCARRRRPGSQSWRPSRGPRGAERLRRAAPGDRVQPGVGVPRPREVAPP